VILGFTFGVFAHVVISLVGIFAGFVVACGLLSGKRLDGWTAWFLITTVLTSVTGFFLPADRILPSHIVGALSLVILAVTIPARYKFRMAGVWRLTYVIGAMLSLYFNVFVLVVQLFLKVPSLHSLAPKGEEPPFAVAQGCVLVGFIALTTIAAKRFRLAPSLAT